MKPRFVWSLALVDARSLGMLRGWSKVEVLEAAPRVWLRAPLLSDEQWEQCLRLPGVDRYTVLEETSLDDEQLLRVGRSVPQGKLPQGAWSPLRDWLRLELPSASDGTRRVPTPTRLTLVRTVEPAEPNWLLTTLRDWIAYVETAPQVRLARWTFLAAADGRVVVRGAPLPSLPGRRFVEQSGIAVPAGSTWSPAVEAGIVRETLQLATGDSAWWDADGTWRVVSASDWVQASRSAIRLTAREVSA